MHCQGHRQEQLEGDEAAAYVAEYVVQRVGHEDVVGGVDAEGEEAADGDGDVQSALHHGRAEEHFDDPVPRGVLELVVAGKDVHVHRVGGKAEAQALGKSGDVVHAPEPVVSKAIVANVVWSANHHQDSQVGEPYERDQCEVAEVREVPEQREGKHRKARRDEHDGAPLASDACDLQELLQELRGEDHVATAQAKAGNHEHAGEHHRDSVREERD
mmetsp:Transcript_113279/g.300987  ORF Transcript_113279/g.300987 Transcript_113279/m.300987 type:complete len:215 (-) Transcript_113279:379-1023(-)